MTNIYDVMSKMHVKATGSVEQSVEEDLKKEDPPKEEAKAILGKKIPLEMKATFKAKLQSEPTPESVNENTKGDDEE